MDKQLLAMLVCPLCKGKLSYERDASELWCRYDGLAYPVRDGIPVMLPEQARQLSVDEKHPPSTGPMSKD
ncbi:Trm112 family protein [Halomonas halocynthiae]|uniref:Trm112 family protein n=1 Tax=Halomonas halocynthiae TaxID=176290 RepID=UPI0004031726|nr:Trm112 family protein [Halomonas halocynthiae]